MEAKGEISKEKEWNGSAHCWADCQKNWEN